MTAFEAEYTITAEDAVNVSWAFNRSGRRRTVLVTAAIAIVSFATWVATSFPLAAGIAAGALALLLLSSTRLLLRLQVRWTPATRVGSELAIALTTAGVAQSSAGISGIVEWGTVTRVIEDERAIVLAQGKVPVAPISKRGLGSATAVDDFKRVVRTYAPGASWEVA